MKPVYKWIIGIVVLLALVAGIYYSVELLNKSIKKNISLETQSYFQTHKADFIGPKGDKGDTGAQGAQGSAGKNGANGQAGQAGKDGKVGCTWLGWSNYYPYYDLGYVCPK